MYKKEDMKQYPLLCFRTVCLLSVIYSHSRVFLCEYNFFFVSQLRETLVCASVHASRVPKVASAWLL